MDEGIRDAVVEDATFDALLFEHEQRKLQPEQDPGFKVVPAAREENRLCDSGLGLDAALPDSSGDENLLEPKDDTARTVLRDHRDFAQRIVRRIVASPQSARLEAQLLNLSNQPLARRVLRLVQRGWT